MTLAKPLKIVICAEYQGEGAVLGSTTGFQKAVSEWINQSGIDGTVNVVVYCVGIENKKYNVFDNVIFKQYKPNLSIRDFLPLIPPTIFPFLVDVLPIHFHMIKDIIRENPDVIHTFQTFGVTDFSGYAAAKIMKWQKKEVRLVNTVMGEIDTYFADYLQRMVTYFYEIMDSKSLFSIIKDSAIASNKATRREGKVTLGKFLIYTPIATLFYVPEKLFELLGNIQDFLARQGKALLGRLLKQRYISWEITIRTQMNILRGESSTPKYKEKSKYWINYLIKPIQLIYDFVRRGDSEGPRGGINKLLANSFRWFLEKEISAYLNNCDHVTISRREDLNRYQIKTQIWEVPLACDLEKFTVYEPSLNDFSLKVNSALELEALSNTTASKLIKLVRERDIIAKRCILYVGRLSDEKNISILMDAGEQLLREEGMKDKIHFIFVGAGYAAAEIEKRFGENVTVTGLVPNELLPDLYNFIRQRNGFFVSASDTETYGITHEEATACGLPLVAMEKGTRGHFYCPGDTVGDRPINKDDDIATAIDQLAAAYGANDFITALNGLCVPDYSAGLGLSKLSKNCSDRDSATKALLDAMYVMANLPSRVLAKMSQHASEFTTTSKLGWHGTWQLLKRVYTNDLESFNSAIKQKKHTYGITQLNSKLKELSPIK